MKCILRYIRSIWRKKSAVESTETDPASTSDNSMPRKDATIIGKYKLFETIGAGNFAKVKRALNEPTGKTVAIKIIDKSQLTPASLYKLYREATVMKRLDHPNIVKLFQVIDTKQTFYMVMEYAPGGEVLEYLARRGRMKEKEARAKFRQIVSAVEYCHQKGVTHRDLKGNNILFDNNMNIKIADFGFSREFTPGDKLDTFLGSPHFVAPEIFLNIKYDGPEVDIWSLGIILYMLVTGTVPFDGLTLPELKRRVLCGNYQIPFHLSTDCVNLLKALLVRNPANRANLETVRRDMWVNQGYGMDEIKPYVEVRQCMSDTKKIEALVCLGFERCDVENSLDSQKYDDAFATYLLLETEGTVPKRGFTLGNWTGQRPTAPYPTSYDANASSSKPGKKRTGKIP